MKLSLQTDKLSRLLELIETLFFLIFEELKLSKYVSIFFYCIYPPYSDILEAESSFFPIFKPANLLGTWYSPLSWGIPQWHSWLWLSQDHTSAKKCASSDPCSCCFPLARACTDLVRDQKWGLDSTPRAPTCWRLIQWACQNHTAEQEGKAFSITAERISRITSQGFGWYAFGLSFYSVCSPV